MNIDNFLEQLYDHGRSNDSSTSDRSAMMFNITPSTGVFLDLLVTELKPRRILELGTSNGYSTLWLARAADRIGSRVDTVDISPQKADLASDNLAKCGLQEAVSIHIGDCGEYLSRCDSDCYDLIFLDSDRTAYLKWVENLIRVIRFGLIVVDNATTHPQELFEFKKRLTGHFGLSVVTLPIGNGQMIVQRDR
ncbi:MAG: O-methyltransferase [Pirellula sp.]|jgi:predicted O-methyltransferase YrrM